MEDGQLKGKEKELPISKEDEEKLIVLLVIDRTTLLCFAVVNILKIQSKLVQTVSV